MFFNRCSCAEICFFFSEHFPRLIEVYSDGKNKPQPHFAQEFITKGIFVINSHKISVSRGRGMNVLNYDTVSGNFTFEVNYCHPQTELREGNVSTPVCHSVHGGGMPSLAGAPSLARDDILSKGVPSLRGSCLQ